MIRQNGGIFGRNPKFNNVEVDGNLSVNGTLIASNGAELYPGVIFDDGTATTGAFLRSADFQGSFTWATISFTVDTATFTSSGTWVKPNNAVCVIVEMCGGGGAGAQSTTSAGGNGGSAGLVVSKVFAASQLTDTVSVTCGAGGVSSANAGGESLFGAHTTQANSYLRASGGIGGSNQTRTVFGGVGTNSFGCGGLGATTLSTAGSPGRYGGYGPGGGGGGGRTAAGGAGGLSSVNAWSSATAVQTGGGAAGGANGVAGTNATTFHSLTRFGDGGGGGGGNAVGGNGLRGSGGGGGGAGDSLAGGAGGAGVVVVHTVRYS